MTTYESIVNKLKLKRLCGHNHVDSVATIRLIKFLTPGVMITLVVGTVGTSPLLVIALRNFCPAALVGLGRYLPLLANGAGRVPSSSSGPRN